jgi:hemolysin III
MGWLSLFLFYAIWNHASHWSVWLLLIGGVFYSIGCIFYLIKKPFMHSIWHIFVIAGAMSHYFSIMEILKTVH